jgi:hypothetical protein
MHALHLPLPLGRSLALGVAGLFFLGRLVACGGDDSGAGPGQGDGAAPPDDGSGIGTDSTTPLRDGAVVLPDGAIVGPDGPIVSPDGATTPPSYSVLQHHKNPSRDGVYVDPLVTKTTAAAVHLDKTFTGTITGDVNAQPHRPLVAHDLLRRG